MVQKKRQPVAELLSSLKQFDLIRYAAYRTAAKLRLVQKATKLDAVRLGHVLNAVDRSGLRPSCERELLLSSTELRPLVRDAFDAAQKEALTQLSPRTSSETVVELAVTAYDRDGAREGCTLLETVVFLAALCGGTNPADRYRQLLRLVSDHNGCVDRRGLTLLLRSLSQVARLVDEAPAFGGWTVAAAVRQCFAGKDEPPEAVPGAGSLAEDAVFAWLAREPQSLVWLSTLYRIDASSKVTHGVRCSVCNVQPLQGLRYQCLQCLSYNQCQNCFWLGLISKGHKVNHQMQEYCNRTSTKEAGQALWKKMSNWLTSTKKKKQQSLPTRYLPLDRCDAGDADTVLDETVVEETALTGADRCESRPELVSVVGHLMEEKGKLEDYIHRAGSLNSLGPVVREHCEQLELQLRRLRRLVVKEKTAVAPFAVPKPSSSSRDRRVLTRLESTPLLTAQHRGQCLQRAEHLNLSPIDEPSTVHLPRSMSRPRQSLRSGSAIVTNGTLFNYGTLSQQQPNNNSNNNSNNNNNNNSSSNSSSSSSNSAVPFRTEFSLRDLSRQLRQPAPPPLASLASASSSSIDSQLHAELEQILRQLEQLFPTSSSSPSSSSSPPSSSSSSPPSAVVKVANETLVRATNQVADVLAEFVDAFQN